MQNWWARRREAACGAPLAGSVLFRFILAPCCRAVGRSVGTPFAPVKEEVRCFGSAEGQRRNRPSTKQPCRYGGVVDVTAYVVVVPPPLGRTHSCIRISTTSMTTSMTSTTCSRGFTQGAKPQRGGALPLWPACKARVLASPPFRDMRNA